MAQSPAVRLITTEEDMMFSTDSVSSCCVSVSVRKSPSAVHSFSMHAANVSWMPSAGIFMIRISEGSIESANMRRFSGFTGWHRCRGGGQPLG